MPRHWQPSCLDSPMLGAKNTKNSPRPGDTGDEVRSSIISGGKWVYGDRTKAVRYPITSDILLRMVREISDDQEGVNVKAALCVGFVAFLQCGEFTWDTWSPDSHRLHPSRNHIVFQPDGSVILTLFCKCTVRLLLSHIFEIPPCCNRPYVAGYDRGSDCE